MFSRPHPLEMGVEAGRKLLVEEPHWLWAITIQTARHAGLFVYRSVQCRVTDPLFRPVADFLDRCPRLQLAVRFCHPDPSMVFGSAELSLYLERPAAEADLDPEFVAEMHRLSRRILKEHHARV